MRVGAPVVGITHNGHHLKFMQCSDESGQGHPSMLLRGKSSSDRSSSTGTHQHCAGAAYSHLIIFGSEDFYDLISYELVALHLETDGLALFKVCIN